MEATCSSEALVCFYKTTQCHRNNHLKFHMSCYKNFSRLSFDLVLLSKAHWAGSVPINVIILISFIGVLPVEAHGSVTAMEQNLTVTTPWHTTYQDANKTTQATDIKNFQESCYSMTWLLLIAHGWEGSLKHLKWQSTDHPTASCNSISGRQIGHLALRGFRAVYLEVTTNKRNTQQTSLAKKWVRV
jgi:hypothetical protein